MQRQALYFLAPGRVELRSEAFHGSAEQPYRVRTKISAISAGTEMLFFRGQVPEGMAADETLASIGKSSAYPIKYGYCAAGVVEDVLAGGDREWLGRPVFSFQPHQTEFWASAEALISLPDGMPLERAVFLPNMETALNFVQDGRPFAGEFVAVFGLGIVGLLTSALLAQFPLGGLAGFDRYPLRRETALAAGVDFALDPVDENAFCHLYREFAGRGMPDGPDLIYEVSGSPSALDQAIRLAGFSSRVLIGSWYGTKPVLLDLGAAFHRSRIELISSQVSTLRPELSGRWDKTRRLNEALRLLDRIRPEGWITRRFPFSAAADAYQLLETEASDQLQIIFDYP
jgi:alcohol dehydrogenase